MQTAPRRAGCAEKVNRGMIADITNSVKYSGRIREALGIRGDGFGGRGEVGAEDRVVGERRPDDTALGKEDELRESCDRDPVLRRRRGKQPVFVERTEAGEKFPAATSKDRFYEMRLVPVETRTPSLGDVVGQVSVHVGLGAGKADVDNVTVSGDLKPCFGDNLLGEKLAV